MTKPKMTTVPPFDKDKPRCKYCNDTLHWLGAGWGHDFNNMATCMPETERTGKAVRAEPK